MKKAQIAVFILAVIFLILCCSPEKESVISGVIQNLKEPHMTINGQMIKVSPEGQFRHTAMLVKPEYFALDFNIVRLEESDYVEKMNSLWKPFNERR